MTSVTSIGFACLALAAGMALYYRVDYLRRYLIQPALIAGLLLLLLGSQGLSLIGSANYQAWSGWPGFLISFLFSTLILAAPESRESTETKLAGPVFFQGGFVWVLALGQISLGLLVISFFSPEWAVAGHIIEIGWMGGHGSAAALIAVADDLGQRKAAELAMFSATIGLIYGSVSGMLIINWLKRRQNLNAQSSIASSAMQSTGESRSASSAGPDSRRSTTAGFDAGGSRRVFQNPGNHDDSAFPDSSATGTTGSGGRHLDDNALWVVSLIGAVLPVLLAHFLLVLVGSGLDSVAPGSAAWISKLPLFFIALLLAFPVRSILSAVGALDTGKARILNSLILEFLIISAIATLDLGLLLESWEILLALTLAGALWTWVCFFFIAPRLLHHHPEISVINYGMSTGVTALGLLLLRSYRGSIPSAPATVYGLAAPFSAPFIGGGIISLMLPIWTLESGPLVVSGLVGLFAVLILSALLFLRRGSMRS